MYSKWVQKKTTGGMEKCNEIKYKMIIEKFFQNWSEYDLSDSGSTSNLKHDKYNLTHAWTHHRQISEHQIFKKFIIKL